VVLVVGLSVGLAVVSDRQEATEKALAAANDANRDKDTALSAERRGDYVTRIALAYRSWQAGDVSAADRALDGCPTEYRHWEWSYLKRLCHSELLTVDGPVPGGYLSAAFSPDGRLIAAGTARGAVHLLDAATGEKVATLDGPLGMVGGLSFSPGGTLLAVGAYVTNFRAERDPEKLKGALQIWDVARREVVHSLPHGQGPWNMGFSPDGKWLGSLGVDGNVYIWNPVTGERRATLPGHRKAPGPLGDQPRRSVAGRVRTAIGPPLGGCDGRTSLHHSHRDHPLRPGLRYGKAIPRGLLGRRRYGVGCGHRSADQFVPGASERACQPGREC
jgi:hypothetical protein